MRALILLLFFLSAATGGACQQAHIAAPADTPLEAEDEAAEDDGYTLAYYKGETQYNKAAFAAAEKFFRKAFALRPGEDAARYLYYSLLYQGYDLEAADFKRQHAAFTFGIPPHHKGPESIYVDAGPRISANGSAGNLFYGDAGVFTRTSATTRLWQSATYLQQDEDLGRFKQYEYFASLSVYLRHGWYIRPSAHYDYVPYTFITQQSGNVSYTASYQVGPGDTLVYKTNAVQTLVATSPGHTHFFTCSLPVGKRFGPALFEAEPSLHYITGGGTTSVQYISAGTTDSFRRDHLQGSKPFLETGSSAGDTSYRSIIGQAGAGISYTLPVKGGPFSIRAMAYYLWDDHGASAFAYHLSAVLWCRKTFRVYLSWLGKGDLPLALYTEGQYFNFKDPIKARAGISFQIFPLRHFSPMITYQYEHDTRLQDGASLIYHSIYLTLKYNL